MAINKRTVTVCGLGMIGLPLLSLLASKKFHVSGYDISKKKITEIKNKSFRSNEKQLDYLIDKFLISKRKISNLITKSSTYIVCVPTPHKKNNKFDDSYLKKCFETIIPILKNEDLIIIESTCEPLTTYKIYQKIKKQRPELFNKNNTIYLAYCAETILPGNIIQELKNNQRIVGGVDSKSSLLASEIYKNISNKKILRTDPTSAEYIKIIQNSFRDTNIAFANQMDIILRKNKISTQKIITLANTHPRVNILKPGIGVGGHCIPIDPWFLISKNKNTKLLKAVRSVNNNRPGIISNLLYKKIMKMKNIKKLSFCGLTYKENVNDFRESPSLKIIEKFNNKYPEFHLRINDPAINKDLNINGKFFKYIKTINLIEWSDLVIILVPHDKYFVLKKLINSNRTLIIPDDL